MLAQKLERGGPVRYRLSGRRPSRVGLFVARTTPNVAGPLPTIHSTPGRGPEEGVGANALDDTVGDA
jgi:hypothetical protein